MSDLLNDPWAQFPNGDPRAPLRQRTVAAAPIPPQPINMLPTTLPWPTNSPFEPAPSPLKYPLVTQDPLSGYGGMFGRGPVSSPTISPIFARVPLQRSEVNETRARYDLKALGIDPSNFYDLPPTMRDYVQNVVASKSFEAAAQPLYQKDVQLKKETGGIQVYETDARGYEDPNYQQNTRIVPYQGSPAIPSPQATAAMSPPDPNYAIGRPMFEWHPHPIRQPGGDLPSEKDLARTLKYGTLPGVIWYNDGSGPDGHKTILYLAHPLKP